jgi:hypothetical protein
MNIRFLCALALALLPLCAGPGHAQTEAEALADAKAANERKDYVAALAIYIVLHDRGSAEGATMVGLMYWGGLGVQTGHRRRLPLFRDWRPARRRQRHRGCWPIVISTATA